MQDIKWRHLSFQSNTHQPSTTVFSLQTFIRLIYNLQTLAKLKDPSFEINKTVHGLTLPASGTRRVLCYGAQLQISLLNWWQRLGCQWHMISRLLGVSSKCPDTATWFCTTATLRWTYLIFEIRKALQLCPQECQGIGKHLIRVNQQGWFFF